MNWRADRLLFRVFTMASDAELLLSYQTAQSEGAFTQIVQRHGPMVLYTCLRRLGNQHDAEDAAQETFAVLARKAGEIKGSLSGWLHAVALHTANQTIRTRVRRVRREQELVHMNRRSSPPQGDDGDWKEELDAALVELPDPLREAVILRYLEGLKHEEAAARTGCPVSTTAWRSDKGLNQLRSIMARRGVLLSAGALATLLLQEAAATAAGAGAAVATLTASTATAAGTGGSAAGSVAAVGGVKAAWLTAAVATAVVAAGIATSVVLWPTARSVPVYTRPAATFNAGKVGVRGHTFALNDRFLATGNSDQTIAVWDVTTRRQVLNLGGDVDDGAIALAFSPTQNVLATAGDAGVVKLWDLEAGQEMAALPAQPRPSQMNSLAFTPDGTLLACGGWNGTVIVFDLATRQKRYTLPKQPEGVMTVRFSPDGKLAASTSHNGIVKVWDAAAGKPLQTFTAHPAGGWSGLAFSPAGLLATGGMDNLVKIWDWADGTVRTTLRGHTGPVLSVCWSPDGKLLASGGQDGLVKLWDAATGAPLADYRCGDQALQVGFAADGKSIVTGGWNKALLQWTVEPPPAP